MLIQYEQNSRYNPALNFLKKTGISKLQHSKHPDPVRNVIVLFWGSQNDFALELTGNPPYSRCGGDHIFVNIQETSWPFLGRDVIRDRGMWMDVRFLISFIFFVYSLVLFWADFSSYIVLFVVFTGWRCALYLGVMLVLLCCLSCCFHCHSLEASKVNIKGEQETWAQAVWVTREIAKSAPISLSRY